MQTPDAGTHGPAPSTSSHGTSFRKEIGWPESWPDGRFLLLVLYFLEAAILGGLGGLGALSDSEDIALLVAAALFAAAVGAYCRVGWTAWARSRRLLVVLAGALLAIALALDIEVNERFAVGGLIGAAGFVAILEPRRPYLQRLYLCRFPLLGAVILAGFPFVAISVYPQLLGNMFVLHWDGVLLVTFLVVLASWIVAATWRTILRYSEARFGLRALGGGALLRSLTSEAQLLVLTLPAAPAVYFLVTQADETSWWAAILAAIAGWGAARLVLALGALAVAWFTPPEAALDFPLPGAGTRRLDRALHAEVRYCRQVRALLESSLRASKEGYLGPEGRLLPGHALAIGFFFVTLGVYLLGSLLHPASRYEAPALFYLLLVFMLAAWLLPTLSFFLDRFRIPTLAILFAFACVGYLIGDLDHYFELRAAREETHAALPASAGPAPKPGGCPVELAFDRRRANFLQRHPDRRPVIVAVAAGGGGIAASAWTARVLGELQTAFGPEFADSIHLVSSVSGGGVGAMYYLDAFFPETPDPYSGGDGGPVPPNAPRRGEVFERAASSSLGATAWGLAYHDLRRALAGFLLRDRNPRDRAWAMEQVWRRRLGRPAEPTLEAWHRAVSLGRLPIPVFNATIVETGERQLLSPIDLSGDHDGTHPWSHPATSGVRGSRALYGDHELPVVTAARLSATFPFVTPVARALSPTDGPRGHHLADGGYFDNSGLVTTIGWLRSVLELMDTDPARHAAILVVEIRAFPPPGDVDPMERAGWVDLATSPLTTMMKVRTASQIARNEQEMALLSQLADHRSKILVDKVLFELDTPVRAPLSWHLSRAERDAISGMPLQEELERVGEFLAGQGWPESGEV